MAARDGWRESASEKSELAVQFHDNDEDILSVLSDGAGGIIPSVWTALLPQHYKLFSHIIFCKGVFK